MSSTVTAVRADDRELEVWRSVASRLGLPFNRWVRRALNEQAELDLALLRERVVDEGSRDGGCVG